MKNKITKNRYLSHETKRRVLIKFLTLILVLTSYIIFLSIKYGLKEGISATILTWSFFVFCTPIADAGFLLDFPIRLILRVRMIYSEIFVWIIALSINMYAIFFNPQIYNTTSILKVFKHILITPYPFWSIIILSAFGTFLSIYFGDELIDVIKHKNREKYKKHKTKYVLVIIGFIILIIGIISVYNSLLNQLDIKL